MRALRCGSQRAYATSRSNSLIGPKKKTGGDASQRAAKAISVEEHLLHLFAARHTLEHAEMCVVLIAEDLEVSIGRGPLGPFMCDRGHAPRLESKSWLRAVRAVVIHTT